MSSTVRLGAALFNGDHARLADEVARLEAAELDLLHLDVFDGNFVSDLGFPPRTIAALRPLTRLPFEVHLGALQPLRMLHALEEAGTDLLIVHVECLPMLYEAIATLRETRMRVGLALAMGTSLTVVEPVLTLIDSVLLLSRVTGEGGRGGVFDPLVLPRLRRLRSMMVEANVQIDIQVAGAVKRHHIADLVAAGVTTISMGGGIYKVDDMAEEVASMRQIALEAHPTYEANLQ